MRCGRRWGGLLCAVLVSWIVGAGPARAISIQVEGDLAFPGDTIPGLLTLSFEVAGNTPDEDPAAGAYEATSPGTFSGTFDTPTLGTIGVGGAISSITATAPGGPWIVTGETLVSLLPIPVTVTLFGTGMTPDQILPDFTSFTSGSFLVDATGPLGLGEGTGSVTSLEIVPEPAAATLVFAAMALALRRR